MSDDRFLQWFPYAFPFLFVGMWAVISTLFGLMSGWFNLQQWYPDDGSEEPLLRLRGQSGSMGIGVALNNVLQLRAYQSGLGVRIWRIFAPFQKPLKIPWGEIEAEPSTSFFLPMVKLRFGKPANGTMKISARSWFRLVNEVQATGSGRQLQMPAALPVSSRSVAQAMVVQWLVFSGIAAAFFYFVSGLPFAICVGLPAAGFGIGQLIRYSREG